MAVRYSLQPADDEHRFGHGKAEALAGLGQATFIAGSALFLLLEAINRLLHPEPLEAVGVGIGVMAFAIVATLVLLGIQRHVIRLTGSTAIRADSLHYATDLITNLSTIAALFLALAGWHGADPLFALALAGYILYSAFGIGREAIELLMDRELPDETRDRIRELAYARPEVLGVHDLRTRQAGHQYFVQLHIELHDDLPLREAHAAADAVEDAIRAAFPGAEVIVHQDPVNEVDRSRIRAEPRPTTHVGGLPAA
jgi:ferrous-iron efflux pump FieF